MLGTTLIDAGTVSRDIQFIVSGRINVVHIRKTTSGSNTTSKVHVVATLSKGKHYSYYDICTNENSRQISKYLEC